MKKHLLILLALLTLAIPCFAGFDVDGDLAVTGNTTITGTISASNLSGTNTGDQTLSGLGGVASNATITGATKTKITYDAKGLVTSGADATTADIADSTNKRYCTDAQKTVIGNTSGTNSGNETTTTIGTLINGATAKTTPVDADMVGLMDSEATNVVKKLSWTNIKSALKTYFDTVYTLSNLGGVPTSRTVNSKALSANVTLTTADIADSADKRYCTDAQKTVISNTSGTNSGDNATNSQYSGLVTNATHTGDVTGSTALTIANKAVTLAKMNDMATASLIYRKSSGAGAPEVNSLATLKTDLGLSGDNTGDETNATIKTKLGVLTTENEGYVTPAMAAPWNIASVDSGKFIVTYGDTTPAYLSNKLMGDGTINITVDNPGGNETLKIGANSLPAGFANSGQKDASGFANYIARVDNTTVSFTGFGFDAGVTYGGTAPVGIAVDVNVVYILDADGKVYKSVDGGATFAAGVAYGGSNPWGIAVSGVNVYVIDGTTDKVYKSTNSAGSFAAGVSYGGSSPCAIAVSGAYVYILDNNDNKVYRSINSGSSFPNSYEYGGIDPSGIATNGANVYVWDDTLGLYKSINYGVHFSPISTIGGVVFGQISAYGSNVYLTDDSSNKLYKSSNEGNTFDSGTSYGGSKPYGVASNSTDIFIIDNTTHKVYKTLPASALNVTYPDGSHATFDSIANLATLTSDGTWNILIEKGSTTATATKSAITEGIIFPTSPNDGDYHLDKSVTPNVPYKRANSVWNITQFVNLGKAVRTAGTLATPITYPFNGISQNTNGYAKLPNGLIIQWGTFTCSSSGASTVTLPITFPKAFLNVTATQSTQTNNSAVANCVITNTSSFSASLYTGSAYAARNICWFAIGY